MNSLIAIAGTRSPIPEVTAAHAALGLIDGKWTVDILLAMRDRPLRFGALSRELDHIARKVLTQTLRSMQRNGLIWRRTCGIVGKPVEYGLTPLGASLLRCVAGFAQWSNRHVGAVEASRALFDASTVRQPAPTASPTTISAGRGPARRASLNSIRRQLVPDGGDRGP